jgi:hypothetical protein
MIALGQIESWGRGTLKMAELTAQAGLPQSDIEESGGCVLARFSQSRSLPPQRVAKDITERRRVIFSPDGRGTGWNRLEGCAGQTRSARLGTSGEIRFGGASDARTVAAEIGHCQGAHWRKVV